MAKIPGLWNRSAPRYGRRLALLPLFLGALASAGPAGCAPPSQWRPPSSALGPGSQDGASPAPPAGESDGTALSDAVARGKVLFAKAGTQGTGCIPCHGALGKGSGGIPPNAGASLAAIRAAMQVEPMRSLFNGLTDKQIHDLAAYIETLS